MGDSDWATMVTRSDVGRTYTTARPGGIKDSRRLDKIDFQRRKSVPSMCSPGPEAATICTANAGEPKTR